LNIYTKVALKALLTLRQKNMQKNIDDTGDFESRYSLFKPLLCCCCLLEVVLLSGNIMWKDATGRTLKEIDAVE